MARRIPLGPLVSSCADLAEKAGGVIREVLRHGNLRTVDKGSCLPAAAAAANTTAPSRPPGFDSYDPQTAADLLAQELLVSSLRRAFPSLKIVAEEPHDATPPHIAQCPAAAMARRLLDAPLDMARLPRSGRAVSSAGAEELHAEEGLCAADLAVWIDPLDGTRAFTEGQLEVCTVLVGVSYRGRPIAGVLHYPFRHNNNTSISSSGSTVIGLVGRGLLFGRPAAHSSPSWITTVAGPAARPSLPTAAPRRPSLLAALRRPASAATAATALLAGSLAASRPLPLTPLGAAWGLGGALSASVGGRWHQAATLSTAHQTAAAGDPLAGQLVMLHSAGGVAAALTAAAQQTAAARGLSGLAASGVPGAGNKLFAMLAGGADLVASPGTSKWDTCAGHACLAAVGGVATGLDGSPLEYVAGHGARNERGVLAALCGGTHGEVLRRMKNSV